jgi:hypothetical protein
MARKISTLTKAQMKAEMSIAGDPDKIIAMGGEMLRIMAKVDNTNAAELINLEFLMRRLLAESRTWMKIYCRRTGQKIS